MRTGSVVLRHRAVVTGLVAGALWAALRDGVALAARDLLALAVLVLLAVLDVEAGRRAEGARLAGQRPHKGLSGWPFAAVLLVPNPLAVAVVLPVYAYARWRGMRVPLWKWCGSGAIVALGAAATGVVVPPLHHPHPLLLALGGLAFLVVEALGFGLCAVSGDPVDEQWLRAQLRSRAFYGAEAAVLCQAAVLAVLYDASPVLVLLAVPTYAVLQRALLHAPLREAAERDAKTGALRWHSWRERAEEALGHAEVTSLLLVDLDHFKAVNDEHGHLAGDDVLAECAGALRSGLRDGDLLGRFGGEEFCVLLPGADAEQAREVAERLRASVAATAPPAHPGLRVTASFGTSTRAAGGATALEDLLAGADQALYAAKSAGRDCVRSAPAVPVQRTPVPG